MVSVKHVKVGWVEQFGKSSLNWIPIREICIWVFFWIKLISNFLGSRPSQTKVTSQNRPLFKTAVAAEKDYLTHDVNVYHLFVTSLASVCMLCIQFQSKNLKRIYASGKSDRSAVQNSQLDNFACDAWPPWRWKSQSFFSGERVRERERALTAEGSIWAT